LFFKPFLEFSREFVVTFFATRLQIDVIELRLLVKFSVAKRTGEMIDTPGLVQGCEHIPCYYLIANKAKITK
jgi:hypothetical protein